MICVPDKSTGEVKVMSARFTGRDLSHRGYISGSTFQYFADTGIHYFQILQCFSLTKFFLI